MLASLLLIGISILPFLNGVYIVEPRVTLLLNSSFFKPHAWSEVFFDAEGTCYITAPFSRPDGEMGSDIYRVDLESREMSSIAQPNIHSIGGLSNGGQCDQHGNLWITDLRHALLKVTPSGEVTQVARTDSTNQPLQGFNDGTFDFTGNMWITGPLGEIAPAEYTNVFSPGMQVNGSLYCYNRTKGDIIKLDTSEHYCNGIAVQHSNDGQPVRVLVAETFTRNLWAYDIVGPCQVRNRRLWGTSSLGTGVYDGGFDGMEFDSMGNLLVTHYGKGVIDVFGPNGGEPSTLITLPKELQHVTNLAFKPHTNEVYLSSAFPATLWTFNWKYTGRLEYDQLITDGPILKGWKVFYAYWQEVSTSTLACVTVLLAITLCYIYGPPRQQL